MDELQVIRRFRSEVPKSDAHARRIGREALLSRIAAAERERRWPRLAVVAAALISAGILAASGLALYDFIAGEPAPPSVTRLLVEEGTAERIGPVLAANPAVITRAAHGVAALESSAGRVLLWAAPTHEGPTCYFVEFERLTERAGSPQGQANCIPDVLSPGFPVLFALHRASVEGDELAVLVGWKHESIASVALRSPEGEERELAVYEGFFLSEIPADRVPEHPQDGKPYRIVASDRIGEELAPLDVTEWTGSRWLDRFPKVTGPRRTLIETTDSRGRPMRLTLIPIEGGETCVETATRTGTSTGCGPELRAEEGIQVQPTLMGSIVFLNGSVGPEVATLELHHQDGYVQELPVVERFVFHGVSRARFEEGKRPIQLVARNRKGEEIAREKLGQRVFGPDSSIWSGEDVGP